MPEQWRNQLWFGDNLDVLQRFESNFVDLVYLDPPFNSNANYNVLFEEKSGLKSESQTIAFKDTWDWGEEAQDAMDRIMTGNRAPQKLKDLIEALSKFLSKDNTASKTPMMAYLVMMAERLVELQRVLKPTGSLYLHCDPTASHYLKLVLDATFGVKNYRNEISWARHNARSTSGRWPRVHDVLLFYSKTDKFDFKQQLVGGDDRKIPHTLITWSDGLKYQTYELTAPGVTRGGQSGKPWRGFNPTEMGRHWANNHEVMEEWDDLDLIHWPKPGKQGGFPRRRDEEPFDAAARVVTVGSVWTDVDRINQSARERLGYPTQKPEALLERILNASSKEGDLVLDPFCGCGTTVAVADRLNRRWIGIDITYLAVGLIERRLLDQHTPEGRPKISVLPPNQRRKVLEMFWRDPKDERLKTEKAWLPPDLAPYEVNGVPNDVGSAKVFAERDRYQFEWWAVEMVGAAGKENNKKGADKGIDGTITFRASLTESKYDHILVSVKSGHVGRETVTTIKSDVDRDKSAIGVLITLLPPTKGMRDEADAAGYYVDPFNSAIRYKKIQILTVQDLFDGEHVAYPRSHDATFKKASRSQTPKPGQTALDYSEPIGEN